MRRAFQGIVCFVCTATIAACSNAPRAPDFTLVDDAGHPWTLSQQHGKGIILTFGFTHCRDTCPATVAKLERVAASAHRRGAPVEVAFVTVDPSRDTVPVIHRFVDRFGSSQAPVVGLTGAKPQIQRAAASYHVWFAPARDDIAHTAVIFFIDPNGRLIATHDDDDSQAVLAQTLAATVPP